uniref:MAM domain-containing protein n=1 Tax=Plectus sambesii TaxID=2011161 RepID=A0A914W8G4_9BILA
MSMLASFSDFLDRATLLNLPQKIWTAFSALVYGHFALGSVMFTFGVICFCLGMEYSIQYVEVNCSDGMNVWVPLTNLVIAFVGLFAIRTLHLRWPAVIYCVGLICSIVFTLGPIIDLSLAAGRWFSYVPTARDQWAQNYAWMDVALVLMAIANEINSLVAPLPSIYGSPSFQYVRHLHELSKAAYQTYSYCLASLFGQLPIDKAADLNCQSFSAAFTPYCRWRNELQGPNGDELEWVRGLNAWGQEEGETIFGTDERASECDEEQGEGVWKSNNPFTAGYWALTGTQKNLPPEDSAMLVSDPIRCQEADGEVRFRYWSSPGVKIRVCTRSPNRGKNYNFCSLDITDGDPGPVIVNIPGSILGQFELVLEARHFNYDAFGVQGGAIIIDDISYFAPAVINCRNRNCLEKIGGSGWVTQTGPIGNRHTGIHRPLAGPYAVTTGPTNRTSGGKALSLGPASVSEDRDLNFCYYRATQQAVISISAIVEGNRKLELFKSRTIDLQPHQWICDKIPLLKGEYDSIDFTAENLRNQYSFFALDQIGLTANGTRVCPL